MLRVLPGVELVLASLCSSSVLISEDLPTLERPKNRIFGLRVRWATGLD